MLSDLYKIFTEEPEKATRAGIRIVSTVLLLIVAEWIYRCFFGSYQLMHLGEYREWAEFILSGRIAIVIACYLVARYVIHSLLLESLLFAFVEWLCTRRFLKFERDEIKFFLNLFNILKIEDEKEIPQPGKNIDILYEIAGSFKKQEEVEVYVQLKHSLLSNILNFYVLFLLVYFIFIKQSLHHAMFTGIMIVGFLFLITLYVFLHNAIEYGMKHHGQILQAIDIIKARFLVSERLRRYGAVLYKDRERVKNEEFFDIDGKGFALLINHKDVFPDKTKLTEVAMRLKKLGRYLFFISRIADTDAPEVEEPVTGDNYMLINYYDHAQLEKLVKERMTKKLLEP